MYRTLCFSPSFAIAALLSLAACGGGGGTSSTASSTGNTAPAQSGSTSTPSVTSANAGYSVAGVVSGITGITVSLSGTSSASTSTDSAGNFEFASLGAGDYTVAPVETGYIFSPVSLAAVVTSASLSDLNFAATASPAATYALSGTVSGAKAAGFVVTLNGTNVGSAVTDLGGNYSFTGLTAGTYTVSATLDGYTTSGPLVASIGNVDSAANNFTSSVAAGSLALSVSNPLPTATVGVPYSSTVVESVSGGSAPYTYQTGLLQSGYPPLGMYVNPNGKLTGTPSTPGVYAFEVCALDAAGNSSSCEPTTLTVDAASGTTPTTPAPTVVLTASPASINSGGTTTLSWSTTNATTCSASGGWSGAKPLSGSAQVDPTASTSYDLTCKGPGGSRVDSVLVTVGSTTTSIVPTTALTASATTINTGSSVTLKWASTGATACTASGGWSGTELASGSKTVSPATTTTYTLTCRAANGTQSVSKVTVTVDVPGPAPTGTSWVYHNGTFDWPGDYSFSASINYKDTSGIPLSGSSDIKVTITGSFGGWLPYAQNWDFNSVGYTKLTFALKPTVANQVWNVYFVKVGDVPVGIYLDPTKYGPAPVVGQWATYTIPLADLGVLGKSIYKFCIHDETGRGSNTWYVDNVGFEP